MRRLSFFLAWLVLVALGFGPWAPTEARPDQGAWVLRLLLGQWEGENPAVVAEFCLMGLWPPLLLLLLRGRLRDRPLPAWPFVLASCVLGCYVLLPWFFLAPSNPAPPPPLGSVGRAAAVGLALASAGLLGWGLLAGDLPGFAAGVRQDPFLWAMTWDFVAFWVLSVAVAPHLVGIALPLAGPALVAARGR